MFSSTGRKNLALLSIAAASFTVVWYLQKNNSTTVEEKQLPPKATGPSFRGMNLMMFFVHPVTGQMIQIETDPRKFDT